jgi:predicted transcriptional regulator
MFTGFVAVMIQSHLLKNIDCTYVISNMGNKMPSNNVRPASLSMQLQREPIEYAFEGKLRENNGWTFANTSRRGRMEIMAEILLFCSQQKAKTKIMYKINLNYAQLKKHLKDLTTNGLLTKEMDKYTTTLKGYRFLELFVQLHDLLSH